MWKLELDKGSIEGDFPMHRAWIIVSEHTAGHSRVHDMPTLSPQLASMNELRHHLDRLRKQLDEIEREGERYFNIPSSATDSN